MNLDMELIQQLTGIGATPAAQAELFDRLSVQLVNGEQVEADRLQALLAALCHGLAVLARQAVRADLAYAAGLRDGRRSAQHAVGLSFDPRINLELLSAGGEGEG